MPFLLVFCYCLRATAIYFYVRYTTVDMSHVIKVTQKKKFLCTLASPGVERSMLYVYCEKNVKMQPTMRPFTESKKKKKSIQNSLEYGGMYRVQWQTNLNYSAAKKLTTEQIIVNFLKRLLKNLSLRWTLEKINKRAQSKVIWNFFHFILLHIKLQDLIWSAKFQKTTDVKLLSQISER